MIIGFVYFRQEGNVSILLFYLFVCLSVCLFVNMITQKVVDECVMKSLGLVGKPLEK